MLGWPPSQQQQHTHLARTCHVIFPPHPLSLTASTSPSHRTDRPQSRYSSVLALAPWSSPARPRGGLPRLSSCYTSYKAGRERRESPPHVLRLDAGRMQARRAANSGRCGLTTRRVGKHGRKTPNSFYSRDKRRARTASPTPFRRYSVRELESSSVDSARKPARSEPLHSRRRPYKLSVEPRVRAKASLRLLRKAAA